MQYLSVLGAASWFLVGIEFRLLLDESSIINVICRLYWNLVWVMTSLKVMLSTVYRKHSIPEKTWNSTKVTAEKNNSANVLTSSHSGSCKFYFLVRADHHHYASIRTKNEIPPTTITHTSNHTCQLEWEGRYHSAALVFACVGINFPERRLEERSGFCVVVLKGKGSITDDITRIKFRTGQGRGQVGCLFSIPRQPRAWAHNVFLFATSPRSGLRLKNNKVAETTKSMITVVKMRLNQSRSLGTDCPPIRSLILSIWKKSLARDLAGGQGLPGEELAWLVRWWCIGFVCLNQTWQGGSNPNWS